MRRDNLPVSPKLLNFIRMQSFSHNFVILRSSVKTEIGGEEKVYLGQVRVYCNEDF